MLHPRTHRCLVYGARPLICRSFGLASRFEGETTWCPLNFTLEPPRGAFVLDLERVNQPLSVIERLAAGGERRRVRIADIALGRVRIL
jgi:Fe-S-cluster containining protein